MRSPQAVVRARAGVLALAGLTLSMLAGCDGSVSPVRVTGRQFDTGGIPAGGGKDPGGDGGAGVGPDAGLGSTPCIGVTVTPEDDLRGMAQASPEGTTFCLQAGLYRGVSVVPRPGQQFIGKPGVVFDGSRVLTGFIPEGSLWKVGGQTQVGQRTGVCDADHPRCTEPEDLFFDDAPKLHVAAKADVRPGTYFLDYDAAILYVGDDPNGHRVETSVTRNAFAMSEGGTRGSTPTAPGVLIEGIVVQKYASPAQMGAIGDQFPSPGWIIRDCEVRLNHGVGITLYDSSLAAGNHVHHNGHSGIDGSGADLRVEGNEVDGNNTNGFDVSWGGGAGKFSGTQRLVYRGNHAHDNYGVGPWTDTDNVDTLYEDNVVEDNDGPGIMHEISFHATIRRNQLRRNGRRGDYVYSANILISTSGPVDVSGNIVVVAGTSGQQNVLPNTRQGIVILHSDRGPSAGYGVVYASAGSSVHDNDITYLAHQVTLAVGAGLSGSGTFADGPLAGMAGNSFDANHYHAPDCNEPRWYWASSFSSQSFAQFQAIGQELHGSCDSP